MSLFICYRAGKHRCRGAEGKRSNVSKKIGKVLLKLYYLLECPFKINVDTKCFELNDKASCFTHNHPADPNIASKCLDEASKDICSKKWRRKKWQSSINRSCWIHLSQIKLKNMLLTYENDIKKHLWIEKKRQ